MIGTFADVVVGLSLLAMGWGLLTAVINRPPGKAQLIFAAVIEVLVVAQVLIAVVKLIAGHRVGETATTIGYLIGIVILIPVGWLWANSERTRFSGVVLAVAMLAVLGMTLRLVMLWGPQ